MAGSFLSGLGLGFLLSIPPGPVSVSLLRPKGSKWKVISQALGADLLIFFVSAVLLNHFQIHFDPSWLKLGGGIFLIGFAIRSLTVRSQRESHTSIFLITVLNAGVWAAVLGLVAWLLATHASLISFITGFEIGAFIWYLALALSATRMRPSLRFKIWRFSIYGVGLVGVFSILTKFIF